MGLIKVNICSSKYMGLIKFRNSDSKHMVSFKSRNWCRGIWDCVNIIIIFILIVIIPVNKAKDNRKHSRQSANALLGIKQLMSNLIVPPKDNRTPRMTESN